VCQQRIIAQAESADPRDENRSLNREFDLAVKDSVALTVSIQVGL
jgi:hypothetical protein